MNIFKSILGSYNDRQIAKLQKIADKIEKLDNKMQLLSDKELQNKTTEFKQRLLKGETLDKILPEAFAVVREASKRVLGMKHFYVQLIGGIVLHQGRIAEMKTGEGKTLVATLPAYLNALTGQGVYIVTVNEFLAKTQMEEMSKLFSFLGMTTGCILHNQTSMQKREQYACDIIYATNNELGFDFLRDNLVLDKNEILQTRRNFAIIDEADSILIDEARTPLIISGKAEDSSKLYKNVDRFVKTLKLENDYTVDEKAQVSILTESGIKKVEKYFKIKNFADVESLELRQHVTQALKANYVLKENVDYMIKNNEILIIDSFTGRVMEGRRYSEGLHQAIEAKENVPIKPESKTYATITLQNFFRMFKKISGMTGTAITEKEEFESIYHLDVIVVPTNKPIARKDRKDLVFKNKKAKLNAIVKEIEEANKKGQPVLVGTTSVEKSEELSKLLSRKRIAHKVLNAKYLEQEAEIISHAGEKGRITIATNMAGRGTDIKLGEGVKELGGLKVIGTERQESRRIDNQLRGRSGRQGDVGESVFFISLEDDLMRIFATDRVKALMEKFDLPENEPIESKVVTSAIENAQKVVEGNHFDIRRNLIGFDNVINIQREIIYKQRNEVLENESIYVQIVNMINEYISNEVTTHYEDEEILVKNLKNLNIISNNIKAEDLKKLNEDEIKNLLIKNAMQIYSSIEAKQGDMQMRAIEKLILLKVVDKKWIDHLNDMASLKKGISLRAYGQHNPIQEYQKEGSILFDEMVSEIRNEVTILLFNVITE